MATTHRHLSPVPSDRGPASTPVPLVAPGDHLTARALAALRVVFDLTFLRTFVDELLALLAARGTWGLGARLARTDLVEPFPVLR